MSRRLIIGTCPKPFIEEFVDIQSASISSWINTIKPLCNYIGLEVDIILFGDEIGVKEFAGHNDIVHIPDVKCNEFGTPLISDIFKRLQSFNSDVSDLGVSDLGVSDLDVSDLGVSHLGVSDPGVCLFLNTDIVLKEDFVATLRAVLTSDTIDRKKGYLVVGQRIDVDDVTRQSQYKSELHSPDGIDYFLFNRGAFPFVYDYAIGKLVWDQFLVGNAFRRGLTTIDATKTITALHLNGRWYAEGELFQDRTRIENLVEVQRNKSFDIYVKNIKMGTTHYTIDNVLDGTIEIRKKNLEPAKKLC